MAGFVVSSKFRAAKFNIKRWVSKVKEVKPIGDAEKKLE